MELMPIAEVDNPSTTETEGTNTELTEPLIQSMPIEEVENPLTIALRVTSNSSEILHRLNHKIKNIKELLSNFSDRLSLDYGEEGFNYKSLYLDLLIKFIKELGIPFVCQINDSEFLNALESCYNEHCQLKKRIIDIILLVRNVIGFDKDNLELIEYYKFVERINPNFKWTAREPVGDFEENVHEALRILRLCKDVNEALTKPPSKELNRAEQISGAIKAIKTLQKSRNLFKPDFRPIELEFIGDIILNIRQFEEIFFKLFKPLRKDVEKTRLPKKSSPKSEAPKHPESEHELHNRTYLMENEILIPDEGECIEYKDYRYPFNEMIEKTLKKTICSFLNQKGGRLYMGVDDEQKKIYGLTLTSKDRDSLKLDIYQMLNDFYPTITHEDFVKVECLPVYDYTKKAIPGRVAVKIIVKPGDRDKLYSVTKSSLKCFIRKDGYCKNLEADQILSLWKKRSSQQPMDEKIDLKEFDDPKPAKLAEIKYESAGKKLTKQSQTINQTENREEEKKQEVSQRKKLAHQSDSNDQVIKIKPQKKTLMDILGINPLIINPNHRVTYGFRLTGIPSDTTEEEIASLFQKDNLASTHLKTGGKKPHAFINFYDLEAGNNEAKRINDGVKLKDNTLEMVFINQSNINPPKFNPPNINPNQRVIYGFRLTGLPSDTTEEEIVSLFPGVKLASKPKVIRDKESKCIGHAFINFYDLKTGNNEAKRINDGAKLRDNTLEMVFFNQPNINPPKINPPKINPPKINPPKVNPQKVNAQKVNPPKINPPQVNPNPIVTPSFKLKGIPSDAKEEEIKSLFPGVNFASKPILIIGREGTKPHAFINFCDLETGIIEAKRINGGVKLRDNTLEMVVKDNKGYIRPQENQRVTYGFRLTGIPSDTKEEEILSLFQGVDLASTHLKTGGKTPHAFINFYDLEAGNDEAKKINSGEKKLRGIHTLKLEMKPIIDPNQRVTYGFRLTGIPSDTKEEEIVSLFQGVDLASTYLKTGGKTPHAFINFYDLETGYNEAKKINDGEKKLRDNTLKMEVQEKKAAPIFKNK